MFYILLIVFIVDLWNVKSNININIFPTYISEHVSTQSYSASHTVFTYLAMFFHLVFNLKW